MVWILSKRVCSVQIIQEHVQVVSLFFFFFCIVPANSANELFAKTSDTKVAKDARRASSPPKHLASARLQQTTLRRRIVLSRTLLFAEYAYLPFFFDGVAEWAGDPPNREPKSGLASEQRVVVLPPLEWEDAEKAEENSAGGRADGPTDTLARIGSGRIH